jgi:Icc-related predicted phosphoesterase
LRIAAIGDLHCRASSVGVIRPLLRGVERRADVLLLAGDLTETGLASEMEVLVGELDGLELPVIAVLGNHDHESDQAELLTEMMTERGIFVLDGTICEIDGVGFVGVKGFCGGFGEVTIQPFGERALKTFIQASIDEAVRLENALAKLASPRKVAVMHFSPVEDTLTGERLELYPFLGSSRLANALDRHRVDLVVHGHAHHGAFRGYTPGGIPVHNVSRFVKSRPGRRPFVVFEL